MYATTTTTTIAVARVTRTTGATKQTSSRVAPRATVGVTASKRTSKHTTVDWSEHSRQTPRRGRTTTTTRALPEMATVLASHYALPALWCACTPAVMLAYINPIYSFSVGYGLSVLFAAGFTAYAHAASGAFMTPLLTAHVAGAAAYGARLAAFLWYRSVTWDEWRERAKKAPEAQQAGFAKQTMVILLCSALYAMMSSPILWHAQNVNAVNLATFSPLLKVGLALEWIGVALEAVADQTKFNYKATDAGKTRWCDTGLYAKCRHPNYLGEILFWVGLFVAGVPAMITRPVTFIPASLGLLFIVKLMTSAAKRGDTKQAEKYADNAEYKAWVDSTFSLVPGN
jgi:steroid 5-alpha reductase family enzyme